MNHKKFLKKMTSRWKECSVLIFILIFAAIATAVRPFDAESVGYFSDIITPLVLIVAVILIFVGVRRRTNVI